jgi:hypothetical protein
MICDIEPSVPTIRGLISLSRYVGNPSYKNLGTFLDSQIETKFSLFISDNIHGVKEMALRRREQTKRDVGRGMTSDARENNRRWI